MTQWTPAYRWLPIIEPNYLREHQQPKVIGRLRTRLFLKHIHWEQYKPRPKRKGKP